MGWLHRIQAGALLAISIVIVVMFQSQQELAREQQRLRGENAQLRSLAFGFSATGLDEHPSLLQGRQLAAMNVRNYTDAVSSTGCVEVNLGSYDVELSLNSKPCGGHRCPPCFILNGATESHALVLKQCGSMFISDNVRLGTKGFGVQKIEIINLSPRYALLSDGSRLALMKPRTSAIGFCRANSNTMYHPSLTYLGANLGVGLTAEDGYCRNEQLGGNNGGYCKASNRALSRCVQAAAQSSDYECVSWKSSDGLCEMFTTYSLPTCPDGFEAQEGSDMASGYKIVARYDYLSFLVRHPAGTR
eukprot:TRINITY_DN67786_c0_g1_i1.p1 TRINITY_DN67786_c0_g1~~TRINITY_DN67786_c0_g1_i1.p1  ORF type:complete len:303 (-),score=19.02 TRINITY_DN67786_c0_g1_i1:234-1142(-)